MDRILTISESELQGIVQSTVRAFCQEIGIKPRRVQTEWISFNQATKIDSKALGRYKLEAAIARKLIRTRSKDHEKANGIRLVNRRDVEYVIRERLV